jgi:glycosyltransferase involved in cell wall biosynthesis
VKNLPNLLKKSSGERNLAVKNKEINSDKDYQPFRTLHKKTLIVNYEGMCMGGIEKTFSILMKYSLSRGYRVIWITTKRDLNKAFIKDIVDNPHIEKCIYHQFSWVIHTKLNLDKNEDILMISCEPLKYVRGEWLLKQCKLSNYNHFLLLPHFTGNAYYPERFFYNNIARKRAQTFFGELASYLNEINAILGFSYDHLVKYEKNYKILIENKDKKVLKGISPIRPIDEDILRVKAKNRQKEFVIISCSRFDFPHKGYILGLVDEFEKIKDKYKKCKLIIVGDGPGKQRLLDKIAEKNSIVASSIVLTGMLTPMELDEKMSTAHVNIGVAGALLVGAKQGVPSINVRHYVEDCEAYGFLSDDGGCELRTDKGNGLYSYIKELIEDDEDEYLNRCRNDFLKYTKIHDVDPDYIYRQKNKCTKRITFYNIIKARVYSILIELIQGVFHVPGYDKE